MKNYVFEYFGTSALCQSPEQAVDFINQLYYRGQHSSRLQCNTFCRKKIEELFSFNDKIQSLSTTGCGITRINIYPALAPTLEEHNRLYEEQLAKQKAIRLQENAKRLRKIEEDLKKYRPGIYTFSITCPVTFVEFNRSYFRELTYTATSDSAKHAYTYIAKKIARKFNNDPYVVYYDIPLPTSNMVEYTFKKRTTED